MKIKPGRSLVVALLVASSVVVGTAGSAEAAAKKYKNCTALNKDYAHGVAKSSGAKDHTSGQPVTNFKVSSALYNKNSNLDRDDDKIACEKR